MDGPDDTLFNHGITVVYSVLSRSVMKSFKLLNGGRVQNSKSQFVIMIHGDCPAPGSIARGRNPLRLCRFTLLGRHDGGRRGV